VEAPAIVVVLGNRPQFIKHAALARAWSQRLDEARPIVIDTGQHYDHGLAGVFYDELEIPVPDHSLQVGSASHAEQLARMLVPLEEIIRTAKPASVVVYGDTNSTLGGAIAAAKLNVPVAHIEAGLRSFDMTMPEEVNRRLTDHVSTMLFCPTDVAVENLRREGIEGERVQRVGDVMADVAYAIAPAADRRWAGLQQQLGLPDAGTFGLVTIHRAANTEPEALREILEVLRAADIPLVFPMHPRTERALELSGLHLDFIEIPGMHMTPPLGYVDLAAALRNASVALTDSGGLQKEAYLHGIPCITLRDTTEWTETIDAGMNVLGYRDAGLVAATVRNVLDGGFAEARDERPALYGEGDSGALILDRLISHAQGQRSWPL
jgi:UDP-N-acetylglucosamine 2-epimerase